MNLAVVRAAEIQGGNITIEPKAIEAREMILARSTSIEAVASAADQSGAVEIGKEIRSLLKATEKSRQEAKEPALNICRRIDELAKEYVLEPKAELERLSRLVSLFQEEEAARVAEEKRRREEAERLASERAELARREAAKAETVMSNEDTLRRAVEAEAAAKEASESLSAVLRAPVPKKLKAAGAATGKVLQWECVDLKEFAAWCMTNNMWHLLKIEPSAAGIKTWLVSGMVVPGLRLWEETKTVIRA